MQQLIILTTPRTLTLDTVNEKRYLKVTKQVYVQYDIPNRHLPTLIDNIFTNDNNHKTSAVKSSHDTFMWCDI